MREVINFAIGDLPFASIMEIKINLGCSFFSDVRNFRTFTVLLYIFSLFYFYRKKLQAFIWDSSRLEYEDANDCDLVTAGELFGRSGLGVGLRKGSPWTHLISLKILELHEGGQMEKLDNKWILVESTDCPQRDHTPATLGLTNMAGNVLVKI